MAVAASVALLAGCSSPNPLKPGVDGSAGTTAATGSGTAVDLTPAPPFDAFGTVSVRVTLPDGTTEEWCLLLADTDDLRSRGLMEVTDLAGYEGMAFSWGGEEVSSAFYMFNTDLPLSIAYFGADGRYLGANDMPPCESSEASACPVYMAPAPFTTAVEVPLGGLADRGMVPGSTLTDLGTPCAPT